VINQDAGNQQNMQKAWKNNRHATHWPGKNENNNWANRVG